MARLFEVSQGQVQVRAEFSEPQFGLFEKPAPFYRLLLQGLSKHGLKLSDMKIEWASNEQTLADYHLRCFLLNFGGTLRFRTDRIEMFFNVARVSEPEMTEVAVAAFAAVIEHLTDFSFRTYETEIALHGVVTNTKPGDVLGTFIKGRPEQLGPSLGAGCVFYYGEEGERLSSNLTIDLSALVNDGLLVRTYAIWDAGKVVATDLPFATASHLRRSLDAIGLERPATG